ncbi:hypothetical protein H4R34_004089 [Dimargaris verticillata]|uniref:Transcription factor domain-containing protein n=1 Tax=Dimargaris verticillata TaxID=2761393 RepID=A0A9W8EC07_9FUNG|nr:hypothetical protein H4R34_004089 [Dimargaris verticillata]
MVSSTERFTAHGIPIALMRHGMYFCGFLQALERHRLGVLSEMLQQLVLPASIAPPTQCISVEETGGIDTYSRYYLLHRHVVLTSQFLAQVFTQRVNTDDFYHVCFHSVLSGPTDHALTLHESTLYHPMVIQRLVAYFFHHFVYWEPFLQMQRFFLKVAQGTVPGFLLNAVLGWSCQMYRDPSTGANPYAGSSNLYLQRAETELMSNMTAESFDSIMTSCLLAMASCNRGDAERLDTFNSLVSRLLIYHQFYMVDSPWRIQQLPRPLSQLDFVVRECRRRMFWSHLFITTMANMLGKASFTFELDIIHVDDANAMSFQDFFLVDDPDNRLPSVIGPVFSLTCMTIYGRQLLYLMVRITKFLQAARASKSISARRLRTLNRSLDQWFQLVPEEFKITAANSDDSNRLNRDQLIRANSLMQLAYYLAVFLVNSPENLQYLDPNKHSTVVDECRTTAWRALSDLVQTIIVPTLQMPVAKRPLNVFLYAVYGFISCATHLAQMPTKQQEVYSAQLDAIYSITRDYLDYSQFSHALKGMLRATAAKHKLVWQPPDE